MANNNKLLSEELQKHTTLITKLQEDQQTFRKKYAKIIEENKALKRKQEQLEAEVTFSERSNEIPLQRVHNWFGGMRDLTFFSR